MNYLRYRLAPRKVKPEKGTGTSFFSFPLQFQAIDQLTHVPVLQCFEFCDPFIFDKDVREVLSNDLVSRGDQDRSLSF